MAKPEWGTKRTCEKCGTRFYDLRRSSVVCPQCGTPWAPKPSGRAQRAVEAVGRVAPAAAVVVPALEPDVEADLEIADEEEEIVEEEAEEEIIEDASDLGDEDVDEVIETEEEGEAKE